jgi:hypothetical protein
MIGMEQSILIEKNVGLKMQPCLTPTLNYKKSVMPYCDLTAKAGFEL